MQGARQLHQLDRVGLKRMSFYAFHGTSAEEQKTGRQYEVDCDCYLDIRHSAKTDVLADTVDYSVIHARTQDVMHGRSVVLLETLADQVAAAMLALSGVAAVAVCVRKLHPPINGQVAAAEVEIYRER